MDDASDTHRPYQPKLGHKRLLKDFFFCIRILVQHLEQKRKCLQNLKNCQTMDYCVHSTLGNCLIDNRELLNPENT